MKKKKMGNATKSYNVEEIKMPSSEELKKMWPEIEKTVIGTVKRIQELFFWKKDPEFIKNQIPQIRGKFAQLSLEEQFYIHALLGTYLDNFFYDEGFVECVEQVSPDLAQLFDHPVFKVDDYHKERMNTFNTISQLLEESKQTSWLSPEQLEEMEKRIWQIVLSQSYGGALQMLAAFDKAFDSSDTKSEDK